MRIAIVDLGTNSVRFAVYQILPRRQIQVLHKQKIMVQPGKGVFTRGLLSKSTLRRLVKIFGEFRAEAERWDVERFKAFATCALREARNRRQLVQEVKRRHGIHIEVISGLREAKYIALSVLNYENRLPARLALIDIGGGSTEISLVLQGKTVYQKSLPLGAERLAQLFPLYDSHGQIRNKQLIRLRLAVRKALRLDEKQIRKVEAISAIGTSGTVRALAKLLRKKQKGVLRPSFTQAQLEALTLRLQNKPLAELKQISFLEGKRAPQILGGAILLDELLMALQVPKIEVSERSLRDGVMEDWLKNHPHFKY